MGSTRTKVVIINGIPQSGKDTFVKFVKDYCDENEYANVLNLSSVDPIKDALMGFGWDGVTKSDHIRDVISNIKKIWISSQNGPTMFMMNNILSFHLQHIGDDNIVFCHIREPEEINKLVNIINGMDVVGIDVLTVLIDRGNYITSDNNKDVRYSDNPDVIAYYPYDMKIRNSSDLSNYNDKACNFVDDLFY